MIRSGASSTIGSAQCQADDHGDRHRRETRARSILARWWSAGAACAAVCRPGGVRCRVRRSVGGAGGGRVVGAGARRSSGCARVGVVCPVVVVLRRRGLPGVRGEIQRRQLGRSHQDRRQRSSRVGVVPVVVVLRRGGLRRVRGHLQRQHVERSDQDLQQPGRSCFDVVCVVSVLRRRGQRRERGYLQRQHLGPACQHRQQPRGELSVVHRGGPQGPAVRRRGRGRE